MEEELLKFLRENDEVEETEINTINIKDPTEATLLNKRYEQIIKIQHQGVIRYIFQQGELLKKFKKPKMF